MSRPETSEEMWERLCACDNTDEWRLRMLGGGELADDAKARRLAQMGISTTGTAKEPGHTR